MTDARPDPHASTCPYPSAPAPAPVMSPSGCPVSAGARAFDPFGAAYLDNPAACLRWAREGEPVFFSPEIGHWVVTRYADVKAVFRDHWLFSPANALEKITPAGPEVLAVLQSHGVAMGRTMVNEDEPEHMARRRLLAEAFLPERLLAFEPMVRSLARQAMDRFIDRGRADLVRELFHEVPLAVALKFLGVPDDDAALLKPFAVAHTLNTWGRPTPQEQLAIAENVGRFWQTAQRILDDMLARPEGEGWMRESVRQHRLHPGVVPLSYLRSMMMAILAAAHETTSNASANAFMTLLSDRPAWQALCANPALIPNAVEECLRVAGSIIAWRRITTAEAQVGGTVLPAGSKLLLVMASANHDPAHFDDPDRVDLYRENAVEHLSFGWGAHQCMGKNIGRMQMRVFLEEFTQRLPHMRLVDGQHFRFLPNVAFRGPQALWVQWDPARNPERQTGSATADAPQRPPFRIGPPPREGITRRMRLRERHVEGEGLLRLVLESADGQALPPWTPGAHVDLVAGGFRRKYSLCGPADAPERYELVVQREAAGRGGSAHVHDVLREGDAVAVAGPKNLFRLDESAQRWLLLAGGIGITPIIAMADRLKRLQKPYALHVAARDRAHMALYERLLRDHGAQLQLYLSAEGQRMPLAELTGDVDADTRVYACGPQRLLDALQTLAAAWPAGVLRIEHFHAPPGARDATHNQGFRVELRASGTVVQVAPQQTLLDALQAAGHDIPSDCGEGLCGTCEVPLLDGAVDHRDQVLSPAERAANTRMMACCSRAKGPRIVLAL